MVVLGLRTGLVTTYIYTLSRVTRYNAACIGESGWRSDYHSRLPPLRPGIDSQLALHVG